MKHFKTLILVSIPMVLSPVLPLYADDPAAPPSYCLDEIKKVCAGLENAIEKCHAERGDQLSDTCRQLLAAAISMAQSSNGPGACFEDVKQSCGGLEENVLSQCIIQNTSRFSQPCRDFLDATSPQALNTPSAK